MSTIRTVAEFNQALESGGYAFPGGYPLFFLTSDGEPLSFEAAEENREEIAEAIREDLSDGWRVVAVEVNWEDENLFCAHTGEQIESAYGEDPETLETETE